MLIKRWVILAILMFGCGASQLQRTSVSVLAPMIGAELGISSDQMKTTVTAFLIGMVAGYVLITLVTALAGTRWGLTAGFAGAGLASVASGLIGGFTALLVARFALGFFLAALIPAAVQTVREWFPSPLRALAIGLILASFQAFSFIIPSLCWLCMVKGWRVALIVTSIPAVVAAVLCAVLVKKPPAREIAGYLSKAGLASVGILALGTFFTAPIFYWCYGHLTGYLHNHFVASRSTFTTSNYTVVGSICGALLSGVMARIMMHAGFTPSRTRAVLLTACGCLLPLV